MSATKKETSRQKWVRETRESVLRALLAECGVPMSAASLDGNLDVSDYFTGIGFIGVRSQREISAALVWHEKQGNVQQVERDPIDPPGKCYILTDQGLKKVTV